MVPPAYVPVSPSCANVELPNLKRGEGREGRWGETDRLRRGAPGQAIPDHSQSRNCRVEPGRGGHRSRRTEKEAVVEPAPVVPARWHGDGVRRRLHCADVEHVGQWPGAVDLARPRVELPQRLGVAVGVVGKLILANADELRTDDVMNE